jgi:hypothetical protein
MLITSNIKISHLFDITMDRAILGKNMNSNTWIKIIVLKVVTYTVSEIFVQYPHLTFIAAT